MWARLFDNPLTCRIGAALEQHENGLLGTRQTMRVARVFNRLKNNPQRRFRQSIYETCLAEFLAENGPVKHEPPEIVDGWALDRSQRYTGLDRLLADAQQIISERGGVNRGGGERSFFQQILTDEHIARFPSILDFATSSEVLLPIIRYMKLIPVLSVSKPLGVRLNESDVRFAPSSNGAYQESQLFHRDFHDAPMVYCIVTLREVTLRCGPFSILPASESQKATAALKYGARGSAYRITDDQMYAVADRSRLVEQIAPPGTILFVDSSACFHYGSRDAQDPRYLMMYAYVSVCRSDFGDLLRRESPTPVLDDSARTRRTAYPVRPGDSRLRRLLLDRHVTTFARGR